MDMWKSGRKNYKPLCCGISCDNSSPRRSCAQRTRHSGECYSHRCALWQRGPGWPRFWECNDRLARRWRQSTVYMLINLALWLIRKPDNQCPCHERLSSRDWSLVHQRKYTLAFVPACTRYPRDSTMPCDCWRLFAPVWSSLTIVHTWWMLAWRDSWHGTCDTATHWHWPARGSQHRQCWWSSAWNAATSADWADLESSGVPMSLSRFTHKNHVILRLSRESERSNRSLHASSNQSLIFH